eukprot:TRINITY_DN16122_c0_g1_i4.p1 TRINITY_DN16122_c0_g1~~TRINITY_DN16122_c0_g1_i4.p1  ORF type:complete len:323 (-),score=79.04 TRINITY_DN16122_c0_g1_i4:149-1117(-)
MFFFFFFLMIRRPPRSTHCISSAASDVYKRQALYSGKQQIELITKTIAESIQNKSGNQESVLELLISYSLWGNMVDLSLHNSTDKDLSSLITCDVEQIKVLNKNIIANDMPNLISLIVKTKPNRVDFILDNASFELFTDLILGFYLIQMGLTKQIVWHVKSIPWFVSDATEYDVQFLIQYCIESEDNFVKSFGKICQNYIDSKVWVMHLNNFWTTPYDFIEVGEIDNELNLFLQQSDLVIFKGDLNYRKLVEDRKWDPTTSFEVATGGKNFLPNTNFAIVRTVKADTISGLQKGLAEELQKVDCYWMNAGSYGVIQMRYKYN